MHTPPLGTGHPPRDHHAPTDSNYVGGVEDGSVTLALGGTVSVAAFASAVRSFDSLLDSLKAEISPSARIDWLLAGLDFGSAVATALAVPLDEESAHFVPGLVGAYMESAEAVAYGRSTTLSATILLRVSEIAGLVNGGIDEVRFETAEREAVISEPIGSAQAPPAKAAEPTRALGSVRGRVQTLHARGGLRFTLYDAVNDKAVSCYVTAGQEEMLRGIWGHLAEVEGVVSRDPATDRPITVRQVSSIVVIDEGKPGGFRRARGVVPPSPDAPSSEAVIRSLRDAG